MIRRAPILLLDEPPTGLDNESGRRIMAPLLRLTTGRTSIVISHNLLTVREAHLILVLDGGRVVERGTHAELLSLNGTYARTHVPTNPPKRPAAWHFGYEHRSALAAPLGEGDCVVPGYSVAEHLRRGPLWQDLDPCGVRRYTDRLAGAKPPRDFLCRGYQPPMPHRWWPYRERARRAR